jgi:hypothetical protein
MELKCINSIHSDRGDSGPAQVKSILGSIKTQFLKNVEPKSFSLNSRNRLEN